LTKITGVTDIKTNIDEQTCSFRVPEELSEEDLKAKLDKSAESNDHLAGYEFSREET
jgi:hypothetical protein